MDRRKSIVVWKVPRNLTEAQLQEYFQVQSHGGGPVDNVIFKRRLGQAVITFADQQAAANVITYTHILGGSQLVVKPMPPEVFVDTEVDLDIDPYWIQLVGCDEMKVLLEKANLKAKIIRKGSQSYAMRGKLYDLYEVFHRLKEFLTMTYLSSPCMYKETEPDPAQEARDEHFRRFDSGNKGASPPQWEHQHNSNSQHEEFTTGRRSTFETGQTYRMDVEGDLERETFDSEQRQSKSYRQKANENVEQDINWQKEHKRETQLNGQYSPIFTGSDTVLLHALLLQIIERYFADRLIQSTKNVLLQKLRKTKYGFVEVKFQVKKPGEYMKDEVIKKAIYEFLDLYDQCEKAVSEDEVALPLLFTGRAKNDQIEQVILEAQGKFPVLVFHSTAHYDKIFLFGMSSCIPNVKAFIKAALFGYDASHGEGGAEDGTTPAMPSAPFSDQNKRKRGRKGNTPQRSTTGIVNHSDGDLDAQENSKNQQLDASGPKYDSSAENVKDDLFISSNPAVEGYVQKTKERIEFATKKGLHVYAYKANIVEQTTQVIVIAANERLQHGGGVAKAIAKAAGQRLTDYCKRYIKRKGLLKTTQVMHSTAGDLATSGCNYVMHAVGPMYSDYKEKKEWFADLVTTFGNIFSYAEHELEASSVSIPAISSGIFGVPKDSVATAMYEAIFNFNATREASGARSTLTDIHIVNIDDATNLAIVNGFVKKLRLRPVVPNTKKKTKNVPGNQEYDKKMPEVAPNTNRSVCGLLKEEPLSITTSGVKARESTDKPYSPPRTNWPQGPLVAETIPNVAVSRETSKEKASHVDFQQKLSQEKGNNSNKQHSKEDHSTDKEDSINKENKINDHGSELTDKKHESPQRGNDAVRQDSAPDNYTNDSALMDTKRGGTSTYSSGGDPTRNAVAKEGDTVRTQNEPAGKTPLTGRHMSDRRENSKTGIHQDQENGADGVLSSTGDKADGFSKKEKPLQEGKEGTEASPGDNKVDQCVICKNDMSSNIKTLKCSHMFHRECINKLSKPVCPECDTVFGILIGDQPENGTIRVDTERGQVLPGHAEYGAIKIVYSFPPGTQTEKHPNPGKPYAGTTQHAYLPGSPEGREIAQLLREAFRRRLTFTVVCSPEAKGHGRLMWNGIHHKKLPTEFTRPEDTYPDPTYLNRVRHELAAKGVTMESLKQKGAK